MLQSYTPLRYPGGKAKLYSYVRDILTANNLIGETYIEPFAGGAGLALKLLFKKDVRRIVINDFDPAIYSMWYSILNNTDEIKRLIKETPLSVKEWEKQKAIYSAGLNNNRVEYGFSALYLNRTNVSGIIKGGIIGGIEQTGNYLINARFNRDVLSNTVSDIAKLKDHIILKNMDAKDFLAPPSLNSFRKVFIYCDPPYVQKGSKLYKNSFSRQDHVALFETMKHCRRKWLVTYDICDLISETYRGYRRSTIDIHYSAKTVRTAQEFAFFSNNLVLPKSIVLDEI